MARPRSLHLFFLVLFAALIGGALWYGFGERPLVDDAAPGRAPSAATTVETATGSELAALEPTNETTALETAAPPTAELRAALTSDIELTGVTFAQLFAVVEGLRGALVSDFDIACIAPTGALRRARAADDVRATDLEPGALFVVSTPTACPRFVDAAVVVERRAAGEIEPLALTVIPSATIAVNFAPPFAGAAPIERVQLGSGESQRLPWARLPATRAAHVAFDAFTPIAARWRSLVDDDVAATDRAAALTECRAHESFAAIARLAGPPTHGYLSPWAARDVAVDAVSVELEHVPSLVRLTLLVQCDDPLDHDGSLSASARAVQAGGGCAIEGVRLEAGERREWNVSYSRVGSVRGRLPIDACEPFRLNIYIEELMADGGRSTFGRDMPDAFSGPAFVCDPLVPADYRIEVRWHDSSGALCFHEQSFTLAPGEARDLGALAASGNALDVLARFELDSEAGPAGIVFEPMDLVVLLRARSKNTSGQVTTRHVFVEHEVLATISGLASGSVDLEALAVLPHRVRNESAEIVATRLATEGRDAAAGERMTFGLVRDGAVRSITVPGYSRIDFDIAIGATSALTVDAFVPTDFVKSGATTTCWLVRTNGSVPRERKLMEWRGDPSGGGYLSATFEMPVGEWVVFARLALPPGSGEHHFAVAQSHVVVEPGRASRVDLALGPAATLTFAKTFDGRPDMFYGLTPRDLPLWPNAPFWATETAEPWSVVGLLPGTEYTTSEGTVVTSGGAGSTIALE